MITVRDFMTNDPLTVTSDTPLRQVLATMNNSSCRHLPVMQDERLVGIIIVSVIEYLTYFSQIG